MSLANNLTPDVSRTASSPVAMQTSPEFQSTPPLIISAYSVYPTPNSSEGIVNAGLIEMLLGAGQKVCLVTSSHGFAPVAKGVAACSPELLEVEAYDPQPGCFTEYGSVSLSRIASWTWQPRGHLLGAAGRVVDRLRIAATLPPVRSAAWASHAAGRILSWLDRHPHAVVWARATPPQSFDAALRAYRRRAFPLIANFNDPQPFALLSESGGGFEAAQTEIFQRRLNSGLARYAQAWTFPSRRLAHLMSRAAGLDGRRCFVIPHAVPPPPEFPDKNGLVSVLTYTGTFYSTLFTDAVREGLARYARREPCLRLRFVLKRPTADILAWISDALPGAEIYTDVSAIESARLRRESAGLLVLGQRYHAPLLPTKVVEAVVSGRPVLALAPEDTTTGECVRRCGGFVVDPTSAETVEEGVRTFASRIRTFDSEAGEQVADEAVQKARHRFSPGRIVSDALRIAAYARARHCWLQQGDGAEPSPPVLASWP